MEQKTCTRCGETKPLDEFPTHLAHGKRRHRPRCRDCHAADARDYRDAHLEERRAAEREYARTHVERKRANAMRAYERDPELVRDRANMSRARRAGAPVIEFVRRKDIYERDKGICHVCGEHVEWEDFQADHVTPLETGGGEHSERNIKVSHRSCNLARRKKRAVA